MQKMAALVAGLRDIYVRAVLSAVYSGHGGVKVLSFLMT